MSWTMQVKVPQVTEQTRAAILAVAPINLLVDIPLVRTEKEAAAFALNHANTGRRLETTEVATGVKDIIEDTTGPTLVWIVRLNIIGD